MNISLRPSLLLLVLTGNPTFQNFGDSGIKGVDASPSDIKGVALTDVDPTHLTSSGAEKIKRVLRDAEEHRDSPQKGTSRNRNDLHGRVLTQVETLVSQVEALQARNATLAKRLEDLESCTCIPPQCTSLVSDDREGLRSAIEAMAGAGDTTLTLCPNTTVTWNSSDPLTNNDVPTSFTLQCSPGAGESEGCVLEGEGKSNFFESIVDEANWTYRQITFRNGNATNGGGALRFVGRASTLTIDACRFEDNEAVFQGGAIALFRGTLLVKGSHFVGNSAVPAFPSGQSAGGAVYVAGSSAVASSSADFTGGGNTFRNNSATAGGALQADFHAGIDLCTEGFDANTFVGNQGRDLCLLGTSTLTVQSTTDCGTCQVFVGERGKNKCADILPCPSS